MLSHYFARMVLLPQILSNSSPQPPPPSLSPSKEPPVFTDVTGINHQFNEILSGGWVAEHISGQRSREKKNRCYENKAWAAMNIKQFWVPSSLQHPHPLLSGRSFKIMFVRFGENGFINGLLTFRVNCFFPLCLSLSCGWWSALCQGEN